MRGGGGGLGGGALLFALNVIWIVILYKCLKFVCFLTSVFCSKCHCVVGLLCVMDIWKVRYSRLYSW